MKTICRVAALMCMIAFGVNAQTVTRPELDTRRKYEIVCAYTASASTPSLVVHLPSTVTGVRVRFDKISVRTPQAANVVFEWGGDTPSGGTSAAVRKRNTASTIASTALCDATSATPTSSKTFVLPSADVDYVFDAPDDEFLPGPLNGRTLRVTLSTTVTGSGLIVLTMSEGN